MKKYPNPNELLPHEKPIMLLDSIKDYECGISLTAKKHIEEDNIFFAGHFPGYPVFPGVLLIEMLFQACASFLRLETLHKFDQLKNKDGFNMKEHMSKIKQNSSGRAVKVEKFVFHEEVLPGDNLRITVRKKQQIMNFIACEGEIFKEDKIVAKGIIHTFFKPSN